MNTKRLMKLIEFMEKLPKKANEHFSMWRWIKHRGEDDHGFGKYIRPGDPMTCGTTACALGWAATVPSFRKAGLKVYAEEDGPDNYDVAVRFFDLDHMQFEEIFGGTNDDKTPKQWAKRVRKLVRHAGR